MHCHEKIFLQYNTRNHFRLSGGRMAAEEAAPATGSGWTFLTNHSHVLICLWRDPTMRLRDIATMVGITERAVQRIVTDLEDARVLTRVREGRRNTYVIHPELPLRHTLEAHRNVKDLLELVGG
jgi:DNA-binding MarR family transcriptional regulator